MCVVSLQCLQYDVCAVLSEEFKCVGMYRLWLVFALAGKAEKVYCNIENTRTVFHLVPEQFSHLVLAVSMTVCDGGIPLVP